jgi:RHS repeat-associated protein
VQTPWLRKIAPEQAIASEFQRDMIGLKSYQAGNAVQSQWQRSPQGDLTRIVHRQPQTQQQRLQANKASTTLLGRNTQETIERLLGITAAHAQATQPAAQPTAQASALQANQPLPQPGALGLPSEAAAFFDERYLWSGQGYLLHSQRHQEQKLQLRSHAYDRAGQLLASVQANGQPVSEQASAVAVSAKADTPTTQVWRYAYDQSQKRILAQEASAQEELSQGTFRTSYDTQGRATGVAAANSSATSYNANGQPEQAGDKRYHWDALGRLTKIEQTGQDNKTPSTLASYTYNHQGLRNSKTIHSKTTSDQNTTHYLYSADKQLLAEVDSNGQIQRQYIYLADILLAVIDTQGQQLKTTDSLSKAEQTSEEIFRPLPQNTPKTDVELQVAQQAVSQELGLWQDSKALIGSYVDWLKAAVGQDAETIAYIHSNHLSAPEAATDKEGQLIWQASYAPFGSTTQIKAIKVSNPKNSSGNSSFTLNIRLPGQYFDAESGLHYNRQRYYDPSQGTYLSPDPLGNPDGPNAYAYVANNPITNVDPDGLILFAFDGTMNDESNQAGLTNVVRFRDMYDRAVNGEARYITGVGTLHRDQRYGDIRPTSGAGGVVPDRGGNYTGPARIDRMMLYMRDASDTFDDNQQMQIDIIGFSRGAAQARDFANRIASSAVVRNGKTYYEYTNQQGNRTCQWVNFRFMGLWDTVLSTNRSDYTYQLGIPAQFQHVSHAVALNEYRSAPAGVNAGTFAAINTNLPFWDNTRPHLPDDNHYGGFPLESIGASSNSVGRTRTEMGFIGAHADIGGGYRDDNSLSRVALAWMVGQAQTAGVRMNVGGFNITSVGASPVIHDQSNAIRVGNPITNPQFRVITGRNAPVVYPIEDRQVTGAVTGNSARTMGFNNSSMTNTDTHQFINYTPRNYQVNDPRRTNDIAEVTALNNRTGTVDMQGYVQWLRNNGYTLAGSNQF